LTFQEVKTTPLWIQLRIRLYLVGNSHANYLATALSAAGYKSVVVEMRPWRPNALTVKETKLELDAKLASTPNVVAIIFWCLDHAAFYSIMEDSILPAVSDTGGHYHIHSALITAPSVMFTESVKACTPLFSTQTAAKKILLSPLPRYWHGRCCDDSDHVSNLDELDYENALFTGLDGLRRIIKDTSTTTFGTCPSTTHLSSVSRWRAPGRPARTSERPSP
jgi:hypothetical protein